MSSSIPTYHQLQTKIQKELELLDEIEQHQFVTSIQPILQSSELLNNCSKKRDLFIMDSLQNWIKQKMESGKSLCNDANILKNDVEKFSSSPVESAPLTNKASHSTLYDDARDQIDENVRTSKVLKKEIGSYLVLKTLGEGTFGKVRLCEHKFSKKQVAIKCIEKADVKTSKQKNSVQRELRLMKLLFHPHIIHVHNVQEGPETISMIMEYANGGELFDYIVSKGLLSENESRKFFRQIVSAVDYCHQNSIIHRDLKPENMLLDSNMNIKLIDFGFGNTYHFERQLDTYCGSPFYAAPEMIRGQPYCGPEVDIWSMGVILYALLAGRLPFEAPLISDLYIEIGKGDYIVPKHFSIGASNLISRMLTVDSKHRSKMPEILKHFWVTENGSKPSPENHVPKRTKPSYPNPDSIRELMDFGISENEIRRVLADRDIGLHPISSLFYMVDEARIRKLKNNVKVKINLPSSSSENVDAEEEIYQQRNTRSAVYRPSSPVVGQSNAAQYIQMVSKPICVRPTSVPQKNTQPKPRYTPIQPRPIMQHEYTNTTHTSFNPHINNDFIQTNNNQREFENHHKQQSQNYIYHQHQEPHQYHQQQFEIDIPVTPQNNQFAYSSSYYTTTPTSQQQYVQPNLPPHQNNSGGRPQSMFHPIQQYFQSAVAYAQPQITKPQQHESSFRSMSSSSSSGVEGGQRKGRFGDFVVDHLFNVRAEVDRDVCYVKREIERVLRKFGHVEFYFSGEMNTFLCKSVQVGSFTIETVSSYSRGNDGDKNINGKTMLVFKCGSGNVTGVFALRKLYTKILDELII